MRILIETDDRKIEAHVETILQLRMTGLDERLEQVRVRIDGTPVDPPETTVHACELEAHLDGGDCIRIVETQNDLALAINRTIGRAARQIRRRINAPPQHRCT